MLDKKDFVTRIFVLEYFVVNQVHHAHVYRSFSHRRVQHRHDKDYVRIIVQYRCVILKRLHRSQVVRHRILCPDYIVVPAQLALLVDPEAAHLACIHTQVNVNIVVQFDQRLLLIRVICVIYYEKKKRFGASICTRFAHRFNIIPIVMSIEQRFGHLSGLCPTTNDRFW